MPFTLRLGFRLHSLMGVITYIKGGRLAQVPKIRTLIRTLGTPGRRYKVSNGVHIVGGASVQGG